MMNGLGIWAQAIPALGNLEQSRTERMIETMWSQIQGLGVVEALTFVSFGVVCLFYGWRIFKILVCICFALIGLLLGVWVNRYIEGNVIWLSAIFAAITAFFSVPLMRYGVCILGGLAGGILTTGMWLGLGMPSDYFWAGSMVGVVAGGMMSFIVFKTSVMLFTTLGGSTLMMTGVLAIFNLYVIAPQRLHSMMLNIRWFLPMLILIPMLIGMYFQNRFIKEEPNWKV
jgi:hypothetical protein